VVTGAARGIGLAAATAFLARGAEVELWDVRAADLEAAGAGLRAAHPGRVAVEVVDVSAADAVEAAAARAEARGPVAVLLNSAGISAHRRPALEIAQADWDRMLAVNLTGTWNTCRAFGRAMVARGAGAVVNVASTNAVDPSPGIAHYSVSKAAVAMLTRSLALEWAPRGVRVNAVGPGPIRTPMTQPILEANPALRAEWEARVPLGRLGDPGDLAGIFVYLASAASAWVTGQIFYVEGGWLL
jgi:NAD(P)-dependent dehydrogenase (short-subunit alcohol dehydrogenase family)